MKRSEVDINKVTPMMKQYLDIKNNYPDVIIFFRLGDFYEMFFEDAIIASRELELALTGKNAGLDERIPMCGIPHHASALYIEKLVTNGFKVGICEQLEDPKNVKGIVKRNVTQIVSSGTLVNEESLNSKENNFIGSLIDFNHAYALSYADISTGEIYATLIAYNNTKVVSEIVSLGIKELVVESSNDKSITSILNKQFKIVISYHEVASSNELYNEITKDIDDLRYLKSINHLLSYLEDTQKRNLVHLQKVIVKESKNYLKMDIHTKRNLELTETLRLKDRNYSLLGLLDKTKTAMGSRMLKNFIENPLIDEQEIKGRHDVVELFLKEFILKEDLRTFLYEVYDLERLSGRIAFGNANGRDLIQLRNSLKVLPNIKIIIDKINYKTTIETLSELYDLLNSSINDNPPISIKEGYIIKEGYNHELDELKTIRKGGKDFVARFEQEEKNRTSIKNLKIGYNRVFGYYIEVSKGNVSLIKEEYGYERRQTLSNCERYISPILKEKESLILNAEEKIIELEYNLFIEIRDKIKEYIPRIQIIAKTISELDVLQSFATVAEENNYVRPYFSDEIDIIESRHPVVEKVISDAFVPNNITMNKDTNILLITGPNMAGKSTYMRQMAICSIMAQMGSFIPAKSAKMPIFDAIYTRIGASDDLVSGESTFMVEMNEANNAISNATANSLILFDELGRGTATFDGMSLAQAIIEYIHNHIKCKTLFSTHYHELTDLDQTLNNLKNIHVSAYEEDGNITFLHKIKDGSVDKSYGIHVAKLAHLPKEVIARANQILHIYESKEHKREIKIQQELPLEVHENIIEEELNKINPEAITPLEALNIIYNLKNKINK
jgi:DNA mismatch repair protein MutS